MKFELNRLYQMVEPSTSYCVGCILRCCRHNDVMTSGIIIHKALDCEGVHTTCVISDSETWVEISEEQVMEAMLGG